MQRAPELTRGNGARQNCRQVQRLKKTSVPKRLSINIERDNEIKIAPNNEKFQLHTIMIHQNESSDWKHQILNSIESTSSLISRFGTNLLYRHRRCSVPRFLVKTHGNKRPYTLFSRVSPCFPLKVQIIMQPYQTIIHKSRCDPRP